MVTILSPAWFRLVPAVCMTANCRAGNTVSTTMLLEVADRPLGQPATSVQAGKVTDKVAFTLRQSTELLRCNRGKSSSSNSLRLPSEKVTISKQKENNIWVFKVCLKFNFSARKPSTKV